MEHKMYSSTEAARLIGIKPHRLKYAIDNGDVEDVATTFTGKRVFTESDIERLKEYFLRKMEERDEI